MRHLTPVRRPPKWWRFSWAWRRWLSTEGNAQLAQLYERRFRPEFIPAFEAWVAADPLHNTTAIATPLLMPRYKVANFEKADALERVGDTRFKEARQFTDNADRYIFATVFFAAVLFFVGISMRFTWIAMRLTVLSLSALFLGYGIIRLATLPTL